MHSNWFNCITELYVKKKAHAFQVNQSLEFLTYVDTSNGWGSVKNKIVQSNCFITRTLL